MTGVLYDGTSGDPTVIAYDPGGTTGWAVFSVHPDSLTEPDIRVFDNINHQAWGEFTGSEFAMVDAMVDLADEWPGAALVSEHFIMYERSAGRKDENLLSLVRLNAAFRYGLYRTAGTIRPVERQAASLAMTTVTDDRLKAWGYWAKTEGKPHARDAIRHALTMLKRLKVSAKLRKTIFPAL